MWQVVPKSLLVDTNQSCVLSQKSEDLSYTVVEACLILLFYSNDGRNVDFYAVCCALLLLDFLVIICVKYVCDSKRLVMSFLLSNNWQVFIIVSWSLKYRSYED
jgi:hypothetical protein